MWWPFTWRRRWRRELQMTLDDLVTKVADLQQTANTVAADVAQLKAGQLDPAKVQAISDGLDAVKATLTSVA